MPEISIIRLPEVQRRTGLSRSSIYAMVSRKEFPSPVRLGKRSAGWVEGEVQEWLVGRIEESRRSPRLPASRHLAKLTPA